MTSRKTSRLRRASKTRARIRRVGANRLSVFRSPRHVYAQIIESGESGRVLVSASTIEPDVRAKYKNGGNIDAASFVGERLATKAKEAGLSKVAFDRSGYKYHGRVKALADAAREAGLKF
ncbi:MAG: 50S ribosomal protein L18 [Acidiferrobacteraceae bacterium]|nr:50S ribosomal protein L18 [Acidiferrobacteraceae bacterium]